MHRRFATLVVIGLVALAVGATPVVAQQQVRVETRSLPRDSVRDLNRENVYVKVRTSNPEDLLRIVQEIQSRERALLMELRATAPEETLLRRRLLGDLAHLNRERFGVMSIVEQRCANESGPRPAGYLGLHLGYEMDPMTGEVHFTIVQSVDPGSPSDRAGIAPGDTLVMLGGRDMRGRKPDASGLLEPGNRVGVRVARGSETKEFMLTVVPRPPGIARSCGEFERVVQRLRSPAPGRLAFSELPRAEGSRRLETGAETGAPSEPTIQISIFNPEYLSAPSFAGAQFRPLDDDWRGVLNLGRDVQGVFVNEVAPGTRSAQAGLKKGDVVTQVGDSPATSPMVLVQLLIITERPDATLSLIRNGEKRTIVLRLPPR